VSAEELVAALSKGAGRDVAPFLAPWIEERGFPEPRVEARARKDGKGWRVTLAVTQAGRPYHLLGSVAIDAGGRRLVKPFEVKGARAELAFTVPEKPTRLLFDAGRDLPVPLENPYSFLSFTDEFRHAKVVYGTTRQIEANHTLALRFQTLLADTYSEELPPVVKDSELTEEELAGSDLFVLGAPSDNALAARSPGSSPRRSVRDGSRTAGRRTAAPTTASTSAFRTPWNPERVVWLFAGNSALQLHQMTKAWGGSLPQWAVFRSDEVRARGFTTPARYVFERLAE
jgi:hypothetical protein